MIVSNEVSKMKKLTLGIDVGSTTVKMVVLDEDGKTLFSDYVRHASKVKETALLELNEIYERLGDISVTVSITGSAGLGLSERAKIPFVQEVESAFRAIKELYPQVDASIELGGEDAKIIFITGGVEERMNGSCAGGTGAFIDQMATLLNVNLQQMDELALKAEKAYPIASRCGVFAKSDIQPLINEGATKADLAASFQEAVVDVLVNRTVAAAKAEGVTTVAIAGGVASNSALRNRMREVGEANGMRVVYPEPVLCTDNAAMIGAAAYCEFLRGNIADLTLNAVPGLKLGER